MTISVLMSVYKREQARYLERALKSVWDDQILKPDQIVLIEDGPLGEDLIQVIYGWKQKLGNVLTLCINKENLGLTKSLNIGINVVSSELIARMDSDDVSVSNRFLIQHEFMEKHPDIDILGGLIEIDDNEGNPKYLKRFPEKHENIIKSMTGICPLGHPAVMMRTSIFKDKGLSYDERYHNSQDLALWFDAYVNGCKMWNIQEIVLRFTEANDMYSRRGAVRARNEFLIYTRGIYKTEGFISLRYIKPCFRYVVRLLPSSLIKAIYNSYLYRKTVSQER